MSDENPIIIRAGKEIPVRISDELRRRPMFINTVTVQADGDGNVVIDVGYVSEGPGERACDISARLLMTGTMFSRVADLFARAQHSTNDKRNKEVHPPLIVDGPKGVQ